MSLMDVAMNRARQDLLSSHKHCNPINTTPIRDHDHKTERTPTQISCENKHAPVTGNLLSGELNKGYQKWPSKPQINGSITCPAGGFSIRKVRSLSTRSSTPWMHWGYMSYNRTEHKSITDLPWILRRMHHTRFIHKTAIYPSKAFTKPGRQSPEIKERQSTEHQGDVFKVVCFRSISPAVFKEAMEKVRCWLY